MNFGASAFLLPNTQSAPVPTPLHLQVGAGLRQTRLQRAQLKQPECGSPRHPDEAPREQIRGLWAELRAGLHFSKEPLVSSMIW